jgi:membrane-bound ClpP family serine protease
MNERAWSARIAVRYALLQVPEVSLLILILILVRQWMDVSAWFIWGIVLLWVAKDIILFPFVWHAYDREFTEDKNSMVGMQGIADERLAPSGYVRVHGELWQAEMLGGGPPIERGQAVRVQEVLGLTLLVQPDNEEIRQ